MSAAQSGRNCLRIIIGDMVVCLLKKRRSVVSLRATRLALIDYSVGEILEFLDENDLAKNTNVI